FIRIVHRSTIVEATDVSLAVKLTGRVHCAVASVRFNPSAYRSAQLQFSDPQRAERLKAREEIVAARNHRVAEREAARRAAKEHEEAELATRQAAEAAAREAERQAREEAEAGRSAEQAKREAAEVAEREAILAARRAGRKKKRRRGH